ncbi:MAG: tetratricopeptide repeat protein [Pirellulales bacterium]|nr:tetratricopeptide repeat protein [Pirellulales bacterium]
MKKATFFTLAAFSVLAFAVCNKASAEDAGMEDLQKAIDAKLTANNVVELGQVVEHCRSAIDRGLDKENEALAKQLLAATLVERATFVSRAILETDTPSSRWPELRRIALSDLERAINHVPELANAHLLIARLNALPRGDAERARKAVDRAIELAADDPHAKVKALLIRGALVEKPEDKLADFDLALELVPKHIEALRTRGSYYLGKEDYDKALADFDKAIEVDPSDSESHEARGLALSLMDREEDALKSFERAAELDPKSTSPLIYRARLLATQEKTKKAIEQLDKVLEKSPDRLDARLLRARLYHLEEQDDKALADVDEILSKRPGLIAALQLRAAIWAAKGEMRKAIGSLEQLVRLVPDDDRMKQQLGMYYISDKQHGKAIELFTKLLAKKPDDWVALRTRADALLNVGRQKEAKADYEEALKLNAESSGILNNLAWVMATSPDDSLRDGKRAIELATKACELTEYEAPHILSTLGAAYAEVGDWKNAKKWSAKAVELGKEDEEQLKQLKDELKSYEAKKPWRELQDDPEYPERKKEDAPITPPELRDEVEI